MAKLALGGAQFGLDYGVTNKAGQVSPQALHSILLEAGKRGIDMVDTAAQYGTSEAAIGEALKSVGRIRLITKSANLAAARSAHHAVELLNDGFATSLSRLGVSHVEGFLFHRAADLTGEHGAPLWNAARALKEAGFVSRIGVSVYNGGEISAVLERHSPDIVQLPYNLLDQRLRLDGSLQQLHDAGVEVHARSAYLQGILLSDPAQLPPFLTPLGEPVAAFHKAMLELGETVQAGLLACLLQRSEIARIVAGVTSVEELNALADASEAGQRLAAAHDFSRWAMDAPELLNPALWPPRQ
ncbi:MAG: aldo/keto reductase [Nitratireductor sp.]|nr:aldo/keto reductase [Nitratireductor sp.]